MDLEFWQTYFLEETKKDPLYENFPLILEFNIIEDYLEHIGLPRNQYELNEIQEIDYGSWLFLNALHQAEVQTTIDSLVEKGYAQAYYDEELNDMVYRVDDSITLD